MALDKVANDLLGASDNRLVSMFHSLQHVTGIKGTPLDSDGYQFAHGNGVSTSCRRVSYGVPQGSVSEPNLFSLLTIPLGNDIQQHEYVFIPMLKTLSHIYS